MLKLAVAVLFLVYSQLAVAKTIRSVSCELYFFLGEKQTYKYEPDPNDPDDRPYRHVRKDINYWKYKLEKKGWIPIVVANRDDLRNLKARDHYLELDYVFSAKTSYPKRRYCRVFTKLKKVDLNNDDNHIILHTTRHKQGTYNIFSHAIKCGRSEMWTRMKIPKCKLYEDKTGR